MPTLDRLRLARIAIITLFCAMLVAVIFTAALSHVIPMTGRNVYVIRGASMEPAIPLGSVIAVAPVPAEAIGVGDVLTMRTASGLVVTHRVTGVVRTPEGQIEFLTRGDANAFADEPRWPAHAVLGRVDYWVPWSGFLLTLMSRLSGLIAVLSGMGTLLLLLWGLDEVQAEGRTWKPAPADLNSTT